MSFARKVKRHNQIKEKTDIQHTLVKEGKKVVLEKGKLKIVDSPKPYRKED